MNIQGYKCRKAQLKTSFFDSDRLKHHDVIVTAWFTDDIPYPYGPNFFNGLPGLVLKYEDVYFEYTATNIEFKEIEIPLVPPNLPILSPAEYKEKWIKEIKKF